MFYDKYLPRLFKHTTTLPFRPPPPPPTPTTQSDRSTQSRGGQGGLRCVRAVLITQKPHRADELIRQKQRNKECININGKARRERLVSGKAFFVRRRSWGVVEEGMTGGGRFAPSRLHGNGEGG